MQKEYELTDKAGEFVAGQRRPEGGKTVLLDDEQARYPLISGEIIEAAPKAAAPDTKPKSVKD
jgi:hypothetical protein